MSTRSNALGDFLRARRERLRPEDVGLPRLRRRTPGLRREEVASLAGIGVDWYVRLEQGRSSTPSSATVEALARALRLNEVDRAHLATLAHARPQRRFVREKVPLHMDHVVAGMRNPAYVTGRRWDILTWNKAADSLLGFSRHPPSERNTLLSLMFRAETRALFGSGWEAEARRVIGQFHAAHDLFPDDPAFAELVDRLHESPEFSRWWRAHDVRVPRAGIKVLHHPRRGTLYFEHSSYQSNDDPALRLVILTPTSSISVPVTMRATSDAR